MMALDDFFADRKAYTGSLISVPAMQSFKRFENSFKIFFFNRKLALTKRTIVGS